MIFTHIEQKPVPICTRSTNVRQAMLADIEEQVKVLSKTRTQLQKSLDNGDQDEFVWCRPDLVMLIVLNFFLLYIYHHRSFCFSVYLYVYMCRMVISRAKCLMRRVLLPLLIPKWNLSLVRSVKLKGPVTPRASRSLASWQHGPFPHLLDATKKYVFCWCFSF